jgi:hypothetical protein
MPLDPSIPLGVKVPDSTQQLSSLLNVAAGAQKVQDNSISLQERQALQGVLSDPNNYTTNGEMDLKKAQANIMRVAPTTGMKYMQSIAEAHSAATGAASALAKLTDEDRSRIGSALTALPDDATPDLVGKTIDALNKQYGSRIDPLVKVFKNGYGIASQNGPDAAKEFRLQYARGVLPQTTQQQMNTPEGVVVSNGQESKVVNVKPGVAGMPQGATVPGTQATMQVGPSSLESVETDAQGNKYVVSRTPSGAIVGTRPLQSASPATPGPFTLPPGETPESLRDMQGQRSAAQAAANKAPVMHDINRTIVAEANKGLTTGVAGQLLQRVRSATGYVSDKAGDENATDYNLLGKMLERSALEAAQSMGPHTNAGLEAAVRANGSLDYTPQAIKKIAYLNDAIVSGMEMYRNGLEKAIGDNGNNVFAKRSFDQEWSKVATPQVLRLKNAVDNGNREEISSITKEVGGKGSAGARKLHEQLTQLLRLSGQ